MHLEIAGKKRRRISGRMSLGIIDAKIPADLAGKWSLIARCRGTAQR